MKPSRFRAMPVDEFDYVVSVDSYDPKLKTVLFLAGAYAM